MQLNKFSAKTITSFGIGLCVAVTIAGVALLGVGYRAYYQTQKQLKAKYARASSLEQDIRQLTQLVQKYAQERQRFEALLFSEKDIATFLNNMSEFTKAAQVKIKEMRAQHLTVVEIPAEMASGMNPIYQKQFNQQGTDQPQGPTLAYLPITMVIEARFDRMVNFLIALEKYRQLLTLSNVDISRGMKYPLLDCKFTLRLYSLKQIEAVVKP